MFRYIDEVVSSFGLSGWQSDLVASLIFVLLILSAVPIIGIVMNRIELLQMKLLSKLFGIKIAEFICNRLLFMGTVIHELSHALFAFLSGAVVTKIRCFTLFSKDTLGYVMFSTRGNTFKRSFQLAFTSCAPTVTGCLLIMLLTCLFRNSNTSILYKVIIIYLGLSVVNHMSMSPVDAKNYLKGCMCIFVAFFVFASAFHHFCM